MTEEQAMQVLTEAGYYLGNLWHIDDIDDDSFTKEEKLDILHNAIHRDYVYQIINENIHDQILIEKYSKHERDKTQ